MSVPAIHERDMPHPIKPYSFQVALGDGSAEEVYQGIGKTCVWAGLAPRQQTRCCAKLHQSCGAQPSEACEQVIESC